MLRILPVLFGVLFSITATGLFAIAPLTSDAADLQTIRKRGRLIVAVKDNLRPLGFRGTNGHLQGLEIDLAHQLAQDLLGRPEAVEFRPVQNQERFDAVLNGDVDVAIANVTLTPSRLRILSFSLPYYISGTGLLTNRSTVQRPSDLNSQTIAVLNGSSAIDAVRRTIPTARLLGVASYAEAKKALETGQAMAIAADIPILAGWVQEFPQYRLLSPELNSYLVSVVLPKGHQYQDLKTQIDQTIDRLRSNGWLEQRTRHWGLPIQ